MQRVAVFLLAAGLVLGVAPPAHAAPTSSDPKTAARDAAAWLASQVTAAGFIPLPTDTKKPDLSTTALAVPAFASAGVGKTTVQSVLAYLGKHVDDYVVSAGTDSPGALANLILAAKAAGLDPEAFDAPPGNLVQRLLATQQSNGLFGTADPTFDGAYRQGLALLALASTGTHNNEGTAWLADQQCANGLWTAYRAETSAACPPPDPKTFTGPDTNSTALAVLGLAAEGQHAPAAKGAAALGKVRTADGGWGFLALSSQSTDADSTGLVLAALRTSNRAADTRGITALLGLQVGCTGDPADRGGIAFQPGPGGTLTPNTLATVQSIAALAEVALPVVDATMTAGVPVPCETSPPVTRQGSTSTSTTVVSSSTDELPVTGTSTGALPVGVLFGATGLALVAGARRRRRP